MTDTRHTARPAGRGGEAARHAGLRLTRWGALANLVLAAGKGAAGWLGGSQALVADAVHSLSDLFTDALAWWGLRQGGRGADADHHFGHGRMETVAAALVALVLLATAGLLGAETLARIRNGRTALPAWPVVLVAALSVAVKELLYRLTAREGRRLRSQLLVANAWHHRSDALSSVAVVVGVGVVLVQPSWYLIDSLVALLVALWVLAIGGRILWNAFQEICDRAPPGPVQENICSCIAAVPGVLGHHDVRVRYVGGLYHMEAHVVVDGDVSVRQGHDIADSVRECLFRDIAGMAEVIIHVDPAGAADPQPVRVEQARWPEDADEIRRVRQRVFIDEQGVLPEEEWDGRDPQCTHLLARDREGRAVGCARLSPEGKLGRMAVLREWRGRGVGRALVEQTIVLARRLGMRSLQADAQVRALGFYEKLGFTAHGEEFMDARIPHRRVRLLLD